MEEMEPKDNFHVYMMCNVFISIGNEVPSHFQFSISLHTKSNGQKVHVLTYTASGISYKYL